MADPAHTATTRHPTRQRRAHAPDVPDWLADLADAAAEPLDVDLEPAPPSFPPGALRRARQLAHALDHRPDLPGEHLRPFIESWDELLRQREERLAEIKRWHVIERLRRRAEGS